MINEQKIYESYRYIENILKEENCKKVFIVCDKFILNSFISNYLKKLDVDIIFYTDFTPNPKYEEVLEGISLFKRENCDFIMSIGGGSTIDVAKCINLYLNLDSSKNYLKQNLIGTSVKHLSIPTTAGTGSEANRFAVIYYNGVKQSISHDSLIPNYVILEPKFLETISEYQKKSTMLDALCHAIESYWSINSTDESKKYASESIKIILSNMNQYINNSNSKINELMLRAANLSGKAINISKTTAAHAMSYKITSLYGFSHGHAVAVCLPYIWEYMINNINLTHDKRGIEYLKTVFTELDNLFETNNHMDSINKLFEIYKKINLKYTEIIKEKDLDELINSVNPERLSNNPINLNKDTIRKIYSKLI